MAVEVRGERCFRPWCVQCLSSSLAGWLSCLFSGSAASVDKQRLKQETTLSSFSGLLFSINSLLLLLHFLWASRSKAMQLYNEFSKPLAFTVAVSPIPCLSSLVSSRTSPRKPSIMPPWPSCLWWPPMPPAQCVWLLSPREAWGPSAARWRSLFLPVVRRFLSLRVGDAVEAHSVHFP